MFHNGISGHVAGRLQMIRLSWSETRKVGPWCGPADVFTGCEATGGGQFCQHSFTWSKNCREGVQKHIIAFKKLKDWKWSQYQFLTWHTSVDLIKGDLCLFLSLSLSFLQHVYLWNVALRFLSLPPYSHHVSSPHCFKTVDVHGHINMIWQFQ